MLKWRVDSWDPSQRVLVVELRCNVLQTHLANLDKHEVTRYNRYQDLPNNSRWGPTYSYLRWMSSDDTSRIVIALLATSSEQFGILCIEIMACRKPMMIACRTSRRSTMPWLMSVG